MTYEKPDDFPADVWEKMDEDERECAATSHTWYYDTCENCGMRRNEAASQRTNVHLPSREDVKRQTDKLAR